MLYRSETILLNRVFFLLKIAYLIPDSLFCIVFYIPIWFRGGSAAAVDPSSIVTIPLLAVNTERFAEVLRVLKKIYVAMFEH